MTGLLPVEHVDHINGDQLDNRFENLRAASRFDNARNVKLHSRNRTGVMGVEWVAKSSLWRARIGAKHIGHYRSFEDAVIARKSAEKDAGYHPNHGVRS
jgi:hypothetical protein